MPKLHLYAGVFFVLAAARSAIATTLPAIPLAELFQDADVVVMAQITSGEVIGTGENACGAKYSALVEESFKGSSKDAAIEFGNFYGYEVGSRYILFLTKPGRTHEPMLSTNSMHLSAREALHKRCGTLLNRNTVMHSGYGVLTVHWTGQFKYKDGVRVPTRYVVLPEGTNTTTAMPSEPEEFSDVVWVRLEDMLQILRGLGK